MNEAASGHARLHLDVRRAREAVAEGPAVLADGDNDLLLSVASVWEMQIKIQLGKLRFTVPLSELVESQRQTNGVQVLPVELEHVLALDALPARHRDPFDRLLVAQANVEGASLVSRDPRLSSYPVKLLW